jgi:hypothetical protein
MKIATRKRSFKELVGEFPFLTAAGLAEDPWHTFYDQPGCDWDFWFYRAWLLNTQERVERCADWLEQNIVPTKTAQRGWPLHSYALKHRYEERDIDGYMTEGEFIAAAIMAGFPVFRTENRRSAWFGMSRTSWKNVKTQRRVDNPRPYIVRRPTPELVAETKAREDNQKAAS